MACWSNLYLHCLRHVTCGDVCEPCLHILTSLRIKSKDPALSVSDGEEPLARDPVELGTPDGVCEQITKLTLDACHEDAAPVRHSLGLVWFKGQWAERRIIGPVPHHHCTAHPWRHIFHCAAAQLKSYQPARHLLHWLKHCHNSQDFSSLLNKTA